MKQILSHDLDLLNYIFELDGPINALIFSSVSPFILAHTAVLSNYHYISASEHLALLRIFHFKIFFFFKL